MINIHTTMTKDFVTITPDSGQGGGTVNILAEPNNTANDRKTEITFTLGSGKTENFTIYQDKPLAFNKKVLLDVSRKDLWYIPSDSTFGIELKFGDIIISTNEVRYGNTTETNYLSLGIQTVYIPEATTRPYTVPVGTQVEYTITTRASNNTIAIINGLKLYSTREKGGQPYLFLEKDSIRQSTVSPNVYTGETTREVYFASQSVFSADELIIAFDNIQYTSL